VYTGKGQYVRLQKSDIDDDPTLFRLNSSLNFIHERLSLMESAIGVSPAPAADQTKGLLKQIARAKAVDLNDAFGFNDTEFEIIPGEGLAIKGVDFSKGFNFDPTIFTINGTTFDLAAGGITGTHIADGAIATEKRFVRGICG